MARAAITRKLPSAGEFVFEHCVLDPDVGPLRDAADARLREEHAAWRAGR